MLLSRRVRQRLKYQLVWACCVLLYGLVTSTLQYPADSMLLSRRVRQRLKYQLVWACCVLLYGLVTSTLQYPADENISIQEVRNSVADETTTAVPLPLPQHTTTEPPSGVPTLRPRRVNCTPPAIEQFPKPILGPSFRKHGGLLFHIVICVYSFIGLAIVCDEYFVTSLDRICEEFKLSPDVAGATFMAAGSSAPELATVVIGVFFAKDDIGVSGVIGSAVFNIMFVISVCALFAGTTSYLNWWPLCRDCFFYAISILIMLCVIFDEKISWGESLFMLLCYIGYCIALVFNNQLEAWVQTWPWIPCKNVVEQEHLVTYKTLDGQGQPTTTATTNYSGTGLSPIADPYSTYRQDWEEPQQQQQQQPQQQQQQQPQQQQPQQQTHVPGMTPRPEFYKAKEQDPNQVSPLIKPENADLSTRIQWSLCFPVHYLCTKTMPNCKAEEYKNWYPLTFAVSMTWISFYSYIMVWMITIIGSTLGIPDTVMGLTFVAAGVSVPDALSSLAVVKEGYGDMAVSNAVGSNVFDILICLGLPWFIQTAMIKPGSHVNVYSKGLTYSTLSLLSTVFFLVFATHANGWKLDKRYGVILMVWYLLFIAFASLYELNVFGFMNPPECPSDY